jgi:hypothetical protein
MAEGRNLVLPIWYDVDANYIVKHSPPLADTLAEQFNGDLSQTAERIVERLRLEDAYTQLSGRQIIKILDRNGAHADWTLERTVRVNRTPLDSIEWRVSSDGTLVLSDVSPGRIRTVRNEAGIQFFVIEFPTPIPVGTIFTQRLSFIAREMFRFRKAEGNVLPSLPYDYFDIIVSLPEPNLPSEILAYKKIGKKEVSVPGLTINRDKTEFSIRFERPEVGISHTLAWIWDVENPRDN